MISPEEALPGGPVLGGEMEPSVKETTCWVGSHGWERSELFSRFLFHGSETEPVLPQNQSGWQEAWHRFPWTLEVFILGIYELMDFIALKKASDFVWKKFIPHDHRSWWMNM